MEANDAAHNARGMEEPLEAMQFQIISFAERKVKMELRYLLGLIKRSIDVSEEETEIENPNDPENKAVLTPEDWCEDKQTEYNDGKTIDLSGSETEEL